MGLARVPGSRVIGFFDPASLNATAISRCGWVYDALVPAAESGLGRRRRELVYAGKRGGKLFVLSGRSSRKNAGPTLAQRGKRV